MDVTVAKSRAKKNNVTARKTKTKNQKRKWKTENTRTLLDGQEDLMKITDTKQGCNGHTKGQQVGKNRENGKR